MPKGITFGTHFTPEDMEENTDYQNKIIQSLESLPDDKALNLLKSPLLRKGSFALPYLLDILASDRSESLKKEAFELVVNIKDPSAAAVLAQFLELNGALPQITRIVTACWHSQLDFSKHFGVFSTILCKADYQTAFEAFSVLENCMANLEPEQLQNHIEEISGCLSSADEDKQSLLREMIRMLEGLKKTATN